MAEDCPKKPDGYECALTKGHKRRCLPLYRGVPFGDEWSPTYKKWALDLFATMCAAQRHGKDGER